MPPLKCHKCVKISERLELFETVAVDVEESECATGDVRVVGSGEGRVVGSGEGRLEVCVNSAWGTVCNNDFDDNDASVACGAIEGFNRTGIHT